MASRTTAEVSLLRRSAPAVGVAILAAAVLASPAVAKPHHRRHRVHTTRACANANTPVGATSRQATKTAVVCLINKQRKGRGLPRLRESGLLDRSAQGWTIDSQHR